MSRREPVLGVPATMDAVWHPEPRTERVLIARDSSSRAQFFSF